MLVFQVYIVALQAIIEEITGAVLESPTRLLLMLLYLRLSALILGVILVYIWRLVQLHLTSIYLLELLHWAADFVIATVEQLLFWPVLLMLLVIVKTRDTSWMGSRSVGLLVVVIDILTHVESGVYRVIILI